MHASVLALAAVLAAFLAGAPHPAAAQAACEVAAFRGMTQPGGARTTMRVVNTGEPCRIRYWMQIEPARIPFEQSQISRAPTNGTATATPEGVAYIPRPGFTGADTFTVTTRGMLRGEQLNGQVVVSVTVLPRP